MWAGKEKKKLFINAAEKTAVGKGWKHVKVQNKYTASLRLTC